MAGSRTLFCLGAFSCTFLLTALALYASNYDIERNLEEVVSWIKRNKIQKNATDSLESSDAPVPNALIEQEAPLEDQNIMIVQPRIIRCQCFLCKIPLEPLLMETDLSHEPPTQQYEPILKRLRLASEEQQVNLQQRPFLDPSQWSAMLKRSSRQPKIRIVNNAEPETDDFDINIDDFEFASSPQFREIFYEMLDNSGNRKSITLRQYYGIQENSEENDVDSKSYDENTDERFSFQIPAPYPQDVSAEQVTEYFAHHQEDTTQDDSTKKIAHDHIDTVESHTTTHDGEDNEIACDHSKDKMAITHSHISNDHTNPTNFIKHHTNPMETFEKNNLHVDEPSIEEKKETMRRKRHHIALNK